MLKVHVAAWLKHLLRWYRLKPHGGDASSGTTKDPLFELKGLGKQTWRDLGGGDAMVHWLRSEVRATPPWQERPGSTHAAPRT